MRGKKAVVMMMFVAAACNGGAREEEVAQDTATAAATTSGMEGMQGMQGMDMGGGKDMMQEMHAHMQTVEGAQDDSLPHHAAMHRQMAGNILAQMNRDMQQMNMAADPKWNALVDSVRQDLSRMPEWSPPEMRSAMSAHMSRMRRLMEIHSGMMKNM